MKRKSSFTDDRKASPTKKTCRFFPDDVGRVAPPLSPVQISSKKTDSLPKRRLSARLAPPANLTEWVKTFQVKFRKFEVLPCHDHTNKR